MYKRFWWIEAARGMLTLVFGVVYLSFHMVFYVLISFLGVYLFFDGCFDALRIIRGRYTPRRHLSLYLGATASSLIGLFGLLHPQIALIFIGIIFVVRLVIRGIQVFGEARRWQGIAVGLHWLYGIVLILLGLICLLPAVFIYIPVFLFLFLGFYALGDGLYILGRALYLKRILTGSISRDARQKSPCSLDIPADYPSSTRRALIFVRRSGASGLGHVGWGFEWNNGWWNVGSMENYGNHAFAPAEQDNFWTTHTTHPIETMLTSDHNYDEYKVFFVTDPYPKPAWNALVWTSRQPYRVVHRNCIDTTYDILRTYGLTSLPDPVTEYAPNDWYDSLAGYSYSARAYQKFPIHLHRFSARPLPTQEISLVIPSSLQGITPSWRAGGSGLRGLMEIFLIWQKMVHDVKTVLTLPRKWRREPLPPLCSHSST